MKKKFSSLQGNNNLFYSNASKITFFILPYTSHTYFTHIHIHTYIVWVYKVFIEYGVYIYIYRNIEQDITLSTLRCYFSQYIIVRQCFRKRLNVGMYFSMYIRNSMKYYNNKYVRQKMVNHELTFLERLRRKFIVKFFFIFQNRDAYIYIYISLKYI